MTDRRSILKVDDRVTVRHVTADRAAELYALVDADRAHIGRWMTFARRWRHIDHVREEIETWQADHHACGTLSGAVEIDGRFSGMIYHLRPSPTHRVVEIGYWLASHATGRGVMSRCLAAMLDHSFGELNFHRMVLRAARHNGRSIAMAQRLGFTREGVERQSAWLDGKPVDHIVYSMLAPEWAELSPKLSVTRRA